MNCFEKYQEYATRHSNPMLASGRFLFEAESFKRVVPDIYKKLQLKPVDTLLDIGCNIGELTIPLSFLCNSITAVDGTSCIAHLKRRAEGITNLSFVEGDFLEVDIKEKFDCVLIYDVIQYLDNYDRVLQFILKAAKLLRGGG